MCVDVCVCVCSGRPLVGNANQSKEVDARARARVRKRESRHVTGASAGKGERERERESVASFRSSRLLTLYPSLSVLLILLPFCLRPRKWRRGEKVRYATNEKAFLAGRQTNPISRRRSVSGPIIPENKRREHHLFKHGIYKREIQTCHALVMAHRAH